MYLQHIRCSNCGKHPSPFVCARHRRPISVSSGSGEHINYQYGLRLGLQMPSYLKPFSDLLVISIRVSPKLYKIGNIANKGVHGEQQNKFSKKNASSDDKAHDLLVYTLMPCQLS